MTCYHKVAKKNKNKIMLQPEHIIKVDSRVRVQLGPSPVNHEKNTNRLNKWFRFIKIKRGNM